MTHTATLDASEAVVRAIADRAGEDDTLAEHSLDIHEAAPGAWRVVVYFVAPPTRAETAALARIAREAAAPEARFAIAALPDTDWVAKSLEGLPPVRAGRFLVHGSHDRARVMGNDIGILIEAGEAFGTGHHGTTAGCLRAIDREAKTRGIRNALDLGTGSGVLAIAIAKRCHVPVLASDIDPVAVRVARGNVRQNGAAAEVTTIVAAGLRDRRFGDAGPFDLVVANILAGPLVSLAPAIRRVMAPGATLILSGLLPEQKARIVSAYRGQHLRLRRAENLGGWLTLTFRRG